MYPMDPSRELENLRRNWMVFKRDFKVATSLDLSLLSRLSFVLSTLH